MGVCQSRHGNAAANRNKAISAHLKQQQKVEEEKIKLLLLGAGESGKTTILKQMKVLHLSGYDPKERREFIPLIRKGVIASMRDLIQGARQIGSPLDEALVSSFERFADTADLQPELVSAIIRLWDLPAAQEAVRRRNEFQLVDSAIHFLSQVARVAAFDFTPTDEDILKCRVCTTGIHSISFSSGGTNFEMFDVGGQRSERRKWIHCFENVTAVVFVAAISEYDQTVREDDSCNRVQESLTVFREICNVKYFAETSIILFLNKKDLFEEKIKRVSLKCCFDDYCGGLDYNRGVAFLRQKFESQNRCEDKMVYTHLTCATDTNNIQHVFQDVREIIFTQNMADAGII